MQIKYLKLPFFTAVILFYSSFLFAFLNKAPDSGATFSICNQKLFFDFYKNKPFKVNEDCTPESTLFVELEEVEKEILEFSQDKNKTYVPPEITID